MPSPPDRSTARLVAWAMFDWATSPFAAIVVTFVIPAYFAQAVVGDEVRGTQLWGWMMGASGLVLALLAPIAGAFADAGRRRRPWVATLIAIGVAATAALWLVQPRTEDIVLALLLVALANVAVELAFVVVNAMLPDLAPAARMGRWSGWAWGLGYVAGILVLALLLFGLIWREPPPFGLDPAMAEPVRAAGPLVAVWLGLFSLPLLFLYRERPGPVRSRVVAEGLRRLAAVPRTLRAHPLITRFLVARLLYNEGLNTLFAFGGLFAAGTFGLGFEEVLIFGIVLNVTAGLGALAMAPLDDRLGSKTTIILSLLGLIVCGTAAILAPDKAVFWVAGAALGLFVGPCQAASRTAMARLVPQGREAELFGLYATTGRMVAFMGPWLVALVTGLAGSQRAGMATILVLMVAGLILLWRIPLTPPAPARPAAAR